MYVFCCLKTKLKINCVGIGDKMGLDCRRNMEWNYGMVLGRGGDGKDSDGKGSLMGRNR